MLAATKHKIGAAAVVTLAMCVVLIWQLRRINRLMAENTALRVQVEEMASVREQSQRLREELGKVKERSERNLSELLRLRSQAARMREIEQENTRLKSERDQLKKQSQPKTALDTVPDEETPQWKVAHTAMRFSKTLGLAIRVYSNSNNGQMPPGLTSTIASLRPGQLEEFIADQIPEDADFDLIRDVEFELVFHGRLENLNGRDPSTVMLARQKEPIQLSNGRWARACVTCDAGGRVLVADTLEELAAKEKKLLLTEEAP